MSRRGYLIPLAALLLANWACYAWGPVTEISGNEEEDTIPEESAAATVVDDAPFEIELALVVSGLDQPVGAAHAGDGSRRLFILEKAGRIRILRDGVLFDTPFLDIEDRVKSSGSEQGLLGLAFPPDYADQGVFFVHYSDKDGDTAISQFSVAENPDQADPASEVIVLAADQPAANHNGGQLAFGPDGYLYIGLGDGGIANNVLGNARHGQSLLGKILRIDVASGSPYAIPEDNPHVDDPDVLDEIWAMGLRNPWRFSFDRKTGDLFIGDVGQGQYEEIDFQPAGSAGGQDYGWSVMEGLHCFEEEGCSQTGLTPPITEYDHGGGCSITGGFVYRGQTYPSLEGIYFFGDYCSGIIWGLWQEDDGSWKVARLLDTELKLSSFGEDEAGELYALDIAGSLYQITAP